MLSTKKQRNGQEGGQRCVINLSGDVLFLQLQTHSGLCPSFAIWLGLSMHKDPTSSRRLDRWRARLMREELIFSRRATIATGYTVSLFKY